MDELPPDTTARPRAKRTSVALADAGTQAGTACRGDLVLKSENTTTTAIGTGGHRSPGGREAPARRHADVDLDFSRRARTGAAA